MVTDMAAATKHSPQIPSHLHEILHRNIENTGIGLLSIALPSSNGLAKNLYQNAPLLANRRQLVRLPNMKGILIINGW